MGLITKYLLVMHTLVTSKCRHDMNCISPASTAGANSSAGRVAYTCQQKWPAILIVYVIKILFTVFWTAITEILVSVSRVINREGL